MPRSTSLQLAALYLIAFAIAVVALGLVALSTTSTALADQFDQRIKAEALALVAEHRSEGLQSMLDAVRERDRMPGALEYGVRDRNGAPLAGRLAHTGAAPGWSRLKTAQAGGEPDLIRVYALWLPDGRQLLVGGDLEAVEALDGVMLKRFGLALLCVVLLGAAVGYALTRDIHRRLNAISRTAEAIIDGNLALRIPVRRSGDDLDQLALTLNRMLDRIESLMDSLRQVSNDIAHDLRTPLTRLRQRLEAIQSASSEPGQAEAVEQAVADLDAALAAFAALLRIAQIESGARRAGFRRVDLSEVARTVVEAFAPSAAEQGRRLELHAAEGVVVDGDRELLVQMLANLIENGIRHTPAGARVEVRVSDEPAGAVLSVRDDGPGVPEAERERLFDRFYRLERSRSTPGIGLGLALASAVAKLHAAAITLVDADPGLGVRVVFANGAGIQAMERNP